VNRATQETLFSSESNEWATPDEFYNMLDRRYHFTLDPAGTDENHKCEKYFTEADDGLSRSWGGHNVFMNPPYGRGIGKWLKKAYDESRKIDTIVVCLIPSRTDTKYWHDYCMKANEIYFVKGRLKFGDATAGAPFPSAIIVFRGESPAFAVGPFCPVSEKPFPTGVGSLPRK